jgi:hypothetical protein
MAGNPFMKVRYGMHGIGRKGEEARVEIDMLVLLSFLNAN